MTVEVSAVVPTYQRPELLEACLAALAAQSFPGDRYEVIVADDGSEDATAAVMGASHGLAIFANVLKVGIHLADSTREYCTELQ